MAVALENLTPIPTTDGVLDGYADPAFSPDGRQIMLLHGLFYPDGSSTGGLATMRRDGSRLRYVGDGLGLGAPIGLGSSNKALNQHSNRDLARTASRDGPRSCACRGGRTRPGTR